MEDTFPLFTVTGCELGVKAYGYLVGAIVYSDCRGYRTRNSRPQCSRSPPLRVEPVPAWRRTFPEMLKLCPVAVKFTAVVELPFTVTFWDVGLKVNPVLLGVTVYEPFTKLANE